MQIPVTKPFLPPVFEYFHYIEDIWKREWLTNNGPLVNDLELRLKEKLDVEHLLFTNNGTIALQIAIRALDIKGEVITTPFSYVATTSSIVWEHGVPVMVDICPNSLNIDVTKIESAITEKTSAILVTHVFGNPCDVEEIDRIAKKYNLHVIYDAAHAFGTLYKNRSLLAFGDISTCSFHATKLFHTTEGGAVITNSANTLKVMAMMRNFGHISHTEFGGLGINGKNSEIHAAMGLCNLKYIDEILDRRRLLYNSYLENLKNLSLKFQTITPNTLYNHAYFPVIFPSEETLLKIVEVLNLNNIFPRRYFYPSLSTLPYVHGQSVPVTEEISHRILCLPLYHTLASSELEMICRLIKRTLKY